MKIKATFPPRRDGSFGSVGDIKLNERGEADVPETIARKLVATGNFTSDEVITPMLIANGDETIDLMTMDKAALLAFAKDELEFDIDGRKSDKAIREAIVEFVNHTEE